MEIYHVASHKNFTVSDRSKMSARGGEFLHHTRERMNNTAQIVLNGEYINIGVSFNGGRP